MTGYEITPKINEVRTFIEIANDFKRHVHIPMPTLWRDFRKWRPKRSKEDKDV